MKSMKRTSSTNIEDATSIIIEDMQAITRLSNEDL
jgi:hypothetical protein